MLMRRIGGEHPESSGLELIDLDVLAISAMGPMPSNRADGPAWHGSPALTEVQRIRKPAFTVGSPMKWPNDLGHQ